MVADIRSYYESKLAALRVRMDRLEAARPAEATALETADTLQAVYRGHPNCEELWTDMFQRIVPGGNVKQVRR